MTINKHLSSQPNIGGGALPLNQQQNLERRNRGLSLLNQTAAHCISPSSCDNTTSLNDINLQLHASSTVSNPYTFSISSNKSFSANIEPEVPTSDTPLFKNPDDQYNSVYTDTIPNGVNVIKVIASATGGEFYGAGIVITNKRTKKNWGSADAAENNYDEHTKYIGVTPGKTYTIIIGGYNDGDNPGYWEFLISYSKEINTHTPDVEDY